MMENAWIIPLLPLLSFIVLLLSGKHLKERSAYIGIACTMVSFLLSVFVLWERMAGPSFKAEGVWLRIGDAQITAGIEINPLNALMLVIVSLVSLLVHTYSKGYMRGDGRISTFYAYLGLFTFSMLGLVMSPNLLQLYMFWELMGLGSFLLIGYYFEKREARDAAKKAFIMTRIGDVGLFIGIILLFWKTGSFEFSAIFQAVDAEILSSGTITLIAVLIFIGAIGKSGQFPLHTWLPDAMEGPTPVSALIHAATMVAAGVYLVATMYPLFAASDAAMLTVSIIGCFTALFAAIIAITQNDIKRVLAYSTISQLGYMMLALGSAGYAAGIFHLMTHAFFKSLLFLAAGSIIHALSTQDIRKMGGLWGKLKLTGPFFLIGTLALSGFPLLSGFFSKDEILVAVWNDGHYILFFIALLTACMTAFYMFRLFFLIFAGRGETKDRTISEAPVSMLLPIMILGILAAVSGYVNTPWFGTYLEDWLADGNHLLAGTHGGGSGWIMLASVLVSLAGIGAAYRLYGKKRNREKSGFAASKGYLIAKNHFYVDEWYGHSVIPAVQSISIFLLAVEMFIVEGLMKAIASGVRQLAKAGSFFQNGQVQLYGTVAIIGLAAMLFIFAATGGYIG
ncbi:NADH-quinone oxidoreductase subunit L [Bacillus testis]|uniref:NADH-quinone oxidoreductase subunit L n=1 Tax=Bacillus testis TaxID=1622072 RepID=UPI00067EEEBB|nr:NADH-quinone oxidoreductase subunit L [Bacillus testis]